MDVSFNFQSPLISIVSNEEVYTSERLHEITELSLISKISKTIPLLGGKISFAVWENALNSSEIYKVIIPAGETLVKSKDGAFRGFFMGNKGIKGHAELVKVNASTLSKTSKAVNIGANVINIGSFIVGQYHMAEINKTLLNVNQKISQVSDFQERDFKSNFISLISDVQEISIFSSEILENDELRLIQLTKLENLKSEVKKLLSKVNLDISEECKKNNNINYKEYQEKINTFKTCISYQDALLNVANNMCKLIYVISKGLVSTEYAYNILNELNNSCDDVNEKLKNWHEQYINKFEIDLYKNRRKAAKFKTIASKVLTLPIKSNNISNVIQDEMNYKKIETNIIREITNQTNISKIKTNPNELLNFYENDIEIIVRDGKYYYVA